MYSILAKKPEHVEWILEKSAPVSVCAGDFVDFPTDVKYHSLIFPYQVTLEKLREIAPFFERVVFGPYSDQTMARILFNEIQNEFPGSVTGVHDETTLMAIPPQNSVAIGKRDRLWDHCALANYPIWLYPVADPTEQWLWYCDLRVRSVNVEHVIVSDKAWNRPGLLSGTTLSYEPSVRKSVDNPKINIYALSVFWDLEKERRS